VRRPDIADASRTTPPRVMTEASRAPMISIEEVRRIADAPLHTWLGTLCVSVIVVLVVAIVHRLGARIVRRIAKPYPLMSAILRYIDKPSLVTLALLALEFLWVQADDGMSFVRGMRTAAAVGSIVALTCRQHGGQHRRRSAGRRRPLNAACPPSP